MPIQALLYSVLSGIFFGIWPLISRMSNLSTIWTAITVTVGTAIAVVFGITKDMQLPPTKSLLIGTLAGVVSGLGLLIYGKLISNSEWDMSLTIPITLVITPMIIILGGWFFFHETITPTKAFGSFFGLIAIYLMCK